MRHVRSEIAPAILLTVGDFEGWYRTKSDRRAAATASRDACNYSTYIVQQIKAPLLVVPCNHLLPRLHITQNQPRHTLLYFERPKHSHRVYKMGGSIREKLSKLLEHEPGVKIIEEGSLNNATGFQDAKRGMQNSEFCLHNPTTGDTPNTSCRLFDAIASLCIPVIISDEIELPFEGILDYTELAVFVSVKNALTRNWLVNRLQGFSEQQKERFRANLAGVQFYFEFGGSNGAASLIWEMIYQKMPVIRQAIVAERRRWLDGIERRRPVTCLCT